MWAVLIAGFGWGTPLLGQPGTTIITHGFQLDGVLPAWPAVMGAAMAQLPQAAAPTGTVLVYDPSTGAWSPVFGSGDPTGEIVLIFDWADDSSWFPGDDDRQGTAHGAAAALYGALRAPHISGAPAMTSFLAWPGGAPRRLHFLGHSRGTCVNSEVVRRLVVAGYTVDHVTTLDPHPVGPVADLLDPQPTTWVGVNWADNYFRQDDCDLDYGCFGFDFDGQQIIGAANHDLGLDAFGLIDNRLNSCSLEHSLVHTWYHGTIDTATASDGDCPVERANWYFAGGVGEGYAFSQVAGGASQRPCGPSGGCADAGRTVATPASPIVNGDFEFGAFQDAGWRWHGGGGPGRIIEESGNSFLTLDSTGPSRTHSRFYLDVFATNLQYDLRVFAPGAAASLVITLREAGSPVDLLIDSVPLSSSTSWSTRSVDLTSIPKGRLYSLTVALTPANTLAIADLDEFGLEFAAGPQFWRGDCNGDGAIDLADAVAALSALFGAGGPPPCGVACDANDDGAFDVADAVSTLLALFGSAGPLPPPSVGCGPDPTADALDCANPTCP